MTTIPTTEANEMQLSNKSETRPKKRRIRKLPSREIFGTEFVNPNSKGKLNELLLTQNVSSQNRDILLELWGLSNKKPVLQPITIGSTTSKRQLHVTNPTVTKNQSDTTKTSTLENGRKIDPYPLTVFIPPNLRNCTNRRPSKLQRKDNTENSHGVEEKDKKESENETPLDTDSQSVLMKNATAEKSSEDSLDTCRESTNNQMQFDTDANIESIYLQEPTLIESEPLNEPESPSLNQPESPSLKEPESPSLNEPESPSLNQPESPSLNEPESPSLNEPESPSLNEPESPSLNEPESPSLNQPESPSLNEPESPSLNEPESPSLNEPESPLPDSSISVDEKDSGSKGTKTSDDRRDVEIPKDTNLHDQPDKRNVIRSKEQRVYGKPVVFIECMANAKDEIDVIWSKMKNEAEESDDDWLELSDEEEKDDQAYDHLYRLISEAMKDRVTSKPLNDSKMSKKRFKKHMSEKTKAAQWVVNCKGQHKSAQCTKRSPRKRKLLERLERPYIMKKRMKSVWIVQ